MNRSALPALAGLFVAAALVGCEREDAAPAAVTASAPLTIEDHATRAAPESLERVVRPVTLASGETAEVVYTVIRASGDDAATIAGAGDSVTIRFAAGLDRGASGVEIYDSTDRRRRDFSFSLDDPGVIRGLREAIPGMRVGELRRLEIPWRLAYGENGRGEIPPSTDLVFAVELVSVD